MSRLGYRPAVDGLRAVAILPVIVFHLGAAWLPGGFLGVDVFFVISGYLIGALISAELDDGTFSFRNFWARRVRRIMPALLTMVLLTCVASRYLVTSAQLSSISWDSLSAAFSYANWWMFSKLGDYWGEAAETSPFLHAWSLSVEEQFYLLFPLFLVLVARLKLRRTPALAVIALASFALFVACSIKDPTLAFYVLPTRAWELLLGALTAALSPSLVTRLSSRGQGVVSSSGLLLILASMFAIDGKTGISALVAIPTVGTAAILLGSERENAANRLLSQRPLVFVGKVSYSLYLWHWAVIILAGMWEVKNERPLPLGWLLGLVACCALASHYLVERPARKWTGGVWVAAALLLVVSGVSYHFITRSAEAVIEGGFNPVAYYAAYYDATPIQKERVQLADTNPNDVSLGAWAGVVGKVPNPAWADAYKNGGIPAGARELGGRADVLLIGDSHGCMWARTVAEVATKLRVPAAFFTFDGNVPYFPIPVRARAPHGKGFSDAMFYEYSTRLLKNIDDWKPRVVILASRWASKSSSDFRNVQQLVDFATQRGAKILFITDPPELPWGNNSAAATLLLLHYQPVEGQAQYVEIKKGSAFDVNNDRLEKLAARTPQSRLLDVKKLMVKGDKVQVLDGKDVLYFDDDHLSYQGTSLFKSALTQELSALLGR